MTQDTSGTGMGNVVIVCPHRSVARSEKRALYRHALDRLDHDALYCLDCGEWLEPICDNPGCAFCKGRPKVAVKPTMQTYEIRTVADFLKVPRSRRGVCLREFREWLDIPQAVIAIMERAGCPPGSITAGNDMYRWTDDGKGIITLRLNGADNADSESSPEEES